jgi:hypothetical protein
MEADSRSAILESDRTYRTSQEWRPATGKDVSRRIRAALQDPMRYEEMKHNHWKLEKKLCAGCKRRRARYRYRGSVRWRRGWDLCLACIRGEKDRIRVALAAALTQEVEITGAFSTDPAWPQLELDALTATSYDEAPQPVSAFETMVGSISGTSI